MRRRVGASFVAGGIALVAVIAASVVWPGLDAQQTPPRDTSVWALQTGDGVRYARVNTSVGELDTVRSVSNPSRIVDSPTGAYLFADSDSRVVRIDEAMPTDVDATQLESAAETPAGTKEVVTAGDAVAYLTDVGTVFVGSLSQGVLTQVDPFAEAEAEGDDDDDDGAVQYTADAITVDDAGVLFSYSSSDGSVIRYDIASHALLGRDPFGKEVANAAVTAAGDAWVIVDLDSGRYWLTGDVSGGTPLRSPMVVGEPDPDGDAVYVAGETGLVRLPVDGSAAEWAFGAAETVLGTPARPLVRDGEVLAAWLPEGAAGGTLWSSDAPVVQLSFGEGALPDQRRPVLVDTGDAVILNETRTGWVWTVPDGRLVASSQDWTLDEQSDAVTTQRSEQLKVVIDPKPPIAVADSFGVRPGALVALPVLLNDHDPNDDVLNVSPASVSGLDAAFGTLTATDDDQRLTVRVAPDAEGSATFTYAVTDGTSADGLVSAPATVTLAIQPDDVNTSPQWCPVEGCLQEWPTPEVARGGTVTVPVLPGWVDAEGDPTLLLSVTNGTGIGSVAATQSGEVVYQHADDGSGGEQLIELTVSVADTQGQATTRPLVIRVLPDPTPTVQSFAVLDTIASRLTVDVAPHVTGTTGDMTVSAVRVLDDANATATVVAGTTEFDFVAGEPGVYRVGFTVTVAGAEATGTARITLLPADAPAQLSTAPVVAFVHPQEDATIDLLAAVSNPTRRVLLLSDVVAHPEPGASLSVDAVGQQQLRVSGSTSHGGPGRLGTVSYLVSDGTSDTGASVVGEATVYLLPPAPELAPIAVDDTIVVRAGAQVDIPVLENDISPAGGVPTVNPATVASSSPDALAFASGEVVRYLAPAAPGEYAVEYSVYTAGAPSLADTATVRVRVLPDDSNRAPLPETLEGRVLTGQSAAIEFSGFGMDPDGDVVHLDGIVRQPEVGLASISPDGSEIVYSSVRGDVGQRSFTYRVIDEFGETGEATVRFGVLGGDANPSPVTYTDYVQVQAGADTTTRVRPLANDVDPTASDLTLTDVRPDVPAETADGSASPDYARQKSQIIAFDESTVTIEAGAEPATMSFLYDVESASGNTARGRIVVQVVRERVPDYPVATDTTLTAQNRDDFVTGVDVLKRRVAWSGGDLDDLTLSLWGEQDAVRVDGDRISGRLPARDRVIPFGVTGSGPDGDVTTYAFLRVPGDEDPALTLRNALSPQKVVELASVSFDMTELVAASRSSTLEVGADVRASGARSAAVCAVESGTVVRYDSGAGAPWTDSCIVPVRLSGQQEWTYLAVPVLVTATDPQPVLQAGSLSVGPGESVTYDLKTLTQWQLRTDWDGIRYALEYGSTSFDVSLAGSIVTVTGRDRAVPGTEEVAIVSVSSHANVAPSRLILRVGAAPSTLPRGGSTAQQCSQASGSSCTISVIGTSGEVNPLPGTPLEVVAVRSTGTCAGVSFEVASASTVRASWSADAPGATCSAAVTVRDAQGRNTASERDGRLMLDLQGFPKGPASVRQVFYADGSLTLRVDPGQARLAYPAVTGFVIRSEGRIVATCSPAGVCPAIAAPNGEPREYVASAVNSVGESPSSVRTTAWAYDAPSRPSGAEVKPIATGGEGGIVSVRITGVDAADTGSMQISSAAGESITVAVTADQDTVVVPRFRVGSNSATLITITPLARFEIPPGFDGSTAGAALTVYGNGIGAPVDASLTLTSTSDGGGTSTVHAEASARVNGDGSALRYGIVPKGEACEVGTGGPSQDFSGLPDGRSYTFVMCVESVMGEQSFGRATVTSEARAAQSTNAPEGYTFVVGPTAHVTGNRANWTIDAAPTSPEEVPYSNRVTFSGLPSRVFDANPGIRVRYEHKAGWWQSAWGAVTAAPGSAPYQLQARWSVDSCIGGSQLVPQGTSSNAPSGSRAVITFTGDGVQYFDAAGTLLDPGLDRWAVPAGATLVTGIGVSVDWAAEGWGLEPAISTFSAKCAPNNLPEPIPDPVPPAPVPPAPLPDPPLPDPPPAEAPSAASNSPQNNAEEH